MSSIEGYDTIVIGGGQAGLAAGYYLTQAGEDYVILDENLQAGESWRKRWDSLRLFTPSRNNGLPGLKFPGADSYFPTKDEAAAYLQAYVKEFGFPVQHGIKVDALGRDETGYWLSVGERMLHARNVIVATGPFRTPRIPSQARNLDHGVVQVHSVDYHRPADVPAQQVLVVGAGNSGAEIALELAGAGRHVYLAGRDVGRIPADRLGKILGGKPYWWVLHRVITNATPLGKRMRASVLEHGNPLIRARREEVVAAGVELASRLAEALDGRPQLEDGRTLTVDGIVWATGFKPDYGWIRLPIFDVTGRPRHARGVIPEAPGLYFLGLHFQSGLTSSLLGGVGSDARYITRRILEHQYI